MFIKQTCEEAHFANPALVYDILRTEEIREGKETYLLESREGSDKLARYSIIGFDPAFKFSVKNGILKTKSYDEFFAKKMQNAVKGKENPLGVVKLFLNDLRMMEETRRERFIGGFVGYLSYDFIRYYVDLEESAVDALKQPDCEFLLTKKNIVVDHRAKKAFLISNEFYEDQTSLKFSEERFDRTFPNFEELAKNNVDRIRDRASSSSQLSVSVDFTPNMEKEEYERGVRVAKEYIHAGDILQVVLSQRLEADFDSASNQRVFEFYKRLSEVNPSPYMYFLDFGERKIVGASPEMLVRVEAAGTNRNGGRGRKVESCPIAGTRRRGINEEEDKRLEEEMLNDEKERAEHLMLVDLSRNDIGKVSAFGTVKAPRFMYPEKYSHVQHIVTDVVGELRTDMDEFDALEATFPAGTVSGAPKVRAMEIIEELEPTRRGIYAGCVGYFSFNRAMDTAITIRTAVFEHGKVYLQAGAGIVADSDPEREYKETLSKCAALLECMR